jgi:hypothetical protein
MRIRRVHGWERSVGQPKGSSGAIRMDGRREARLHLRVRATLASIAENRDRPIRKPRSILTIALAVGNALQVGRGNDLQRTGRERLRVERWPRMW